MAPIQRQRPATYADVLAAPEHMVAEIIDDELVLSPRPRARHALVASALVAKLGPPFQFGDGGPGGWWLLPEPELHLQGVDKPIVPDIAGWRTERMPEVPDEAAISLRPDWICEVLSPRTAALDRSKKMRIYAASGVEHAWLIDPQVQTLEVFRLEGTGWHLINTWAEGESACAEPFADISLDLGWLWGRR
jgi:hypothetical protein